jgi:hypothetical protein
MRRSVNNDLVLRLNGFKGITSTFGRASGVVATDATPEELVEAWAWVNADEALIGEGRLLPNGRVAELVGLLMPDQDEP